MYMYEHVGVWVYGRRILIIIRYVWVRIGGWKSNRTHTKRLRVWNRAYAFFIFRWRGLSRQIVDVQSYSQFSLCVFVPVWCDLAVFGQSSVDGSSHSGQSWNHKTHELYNPNHTNDIQLAYFCSLNCSDSLYPSTICSSISSTIHHS